MNLPLYVVDAFADRLFAGNPAAVCPLTQWLPDDLLLKIAAENNYAETAYVIDEGDGSHALRWFTPAVEVELCGHATLATAFVLAEVLGNALPVFRFQTLSGALCVERRGNLFFLDFPARTLTPLDAKEQREAVQAAVGQPLRSLTQAGQVWIAELADEAAVQAAAPDFTRIRALPCRALNLTAPGRDADFVSRFFAPRMGVDEDAVTGSAHCGLVPFWSARLGKTLLAARQLSARGGELHCELRGERVIMGGKAVLFSSGQIHLPPDRMAR